MVKDRLYLFDDVLDPTLQLQPTQQLDTADAANMRGLDNLKDKVRVRDEFFV